MKKLGNKECMFVKEPLEDAFPDRRFWKLNCWLFMCFFYVNTYTFL